MKFFKRWKKNKEIGELQLRIDHCRSTIAEVEEALNLEELHPEIARQVRRLETALEEVDVSNLKDRDLEKMELATNRLLSEFRGLHRQGKLKNIHEGPLH